MELYRMLEYSGFILVNRNTLGPYIFAGCHRTNVDNRDTIDKSAQTSTLID
jgi:lysozyme family protein